MAHLATPSRALAEKIVGEVAYADRFMAGCLHVRAGAADMALYCLEEIFVVLNSPYPQVDGEDLARWISAHIGDDELSRRVREVLTDSKTPREAMIAIRDLIGIRLIQSRQVLAVPTGMRDHMADG